jgi:hypothetical protein
MPQRAQSLGCRVHRLNSRSASTCDGVDGKAGAHVTGVPGSRGSSEPPRPTRGETAYLELKPAPSGLRVLRARTVAQAEQNAATLRLGPLPATAMAEIARLLSS